jgi:hypothetical protein
MQDFSRRRCQKEHRLSKATLLAMIEPITDTYEFFLSIPDEDWEIDSFNPRLREVCVNITQKGQTKKLSVTLPPIV